MIGAARGHPELAQFCEQQRRRVTVVVVQPDRDHRHPGVDGREEPLVGVRAAVMRNLEHVRADIDSCGQHSLLRFDLGVTRQQDAHTAHRRPDDDRGVVRIRPRAAHRDPWREHVKVDVARVDVAADYGKVCRQAARGQCAPGNLDAGLGLGERAGQHSADRPATQRAGDTVDVVEVVVADQQ
jgi:hypothetical protein